MRLPTWLGGKTEEMAVLHPDFGRLVYSSRDCAWVNGAFGLWGYSDIQLLVAGSVEGPSDLQLSEFKKLAASGGELLKRCFAALGELPELEGSSGSTYILTGLSIPILDGSTSGELWNLWFDREGDDHYMFGVQTTDRWRTLSAYAGD